MQDFELALHIDPKMPELYYNKAQLLEIQGDFKGAEVVLTKLLQIAPGNTTAYMKRAEKWGNWVNRLVVESNLVFSKLSKIMHYI